MKITIDSWANGAPIPPRFAFGNIPSEGRFETSDNFNPAISWSDVPVGTKSFAIICHDPDVPSTGKDVNQEGKTIPKELPRVDFYHWVLVNISNDVSHIAEGTDSAEITPKGKKPGLRPYGRSGINSYTDWFADDVDMAGNYGGYDGPCPPWNDSIMHHYYFTVYALDVEKLEVNDLFTGADALEAMRNHIIGQASHVGTYSMNPLVRETG